MRGRRLSAALTLMVLACALVSGCAQREPLYQPAGSLYTAGPTPDYAAYLAGARAYLERAAVAVRGFERDRQIAWRMPFERVPPDHCGPGERVGLLLIHGLADTPAVFWSLAEALAQRCVRVRAILLPGHGTRPGDLVVAESSDWVAAARAHLAGLAERVDRLFVGGHSMGAAIATVLAAERESVDGLLALAPAWRLDGLRSVLWLATFVEPFIDFLEYEPEHNPLKYETLAVNTGDEVREVVDRSQSALGQSERLADLPALVAVSAADSVIDLGFVQRSFRRHFDAPASRMIVYRDARRRLPPWWQSERMVARNGFMPRQRILEISHQSIPVGPDHALYGPGAPLQHCLEPNGVSRARCLELDPEQVWYGAYRGEGERVPGRVSARLTWNPHFAHLLEHSVRLMGLAGRGPRASPAR